MEKPTITSQDLADFYTIQSEFDELQRKASEALVNAKAAQEQEISISRNGKHQVVREKDLWDEIWHNVEDDTAKTVLREKYPQVFELSEKTEEKKEHLKQFAMEKWEINPLAMSLSDIFRIAEAVYEMKQDKV